MPQGAPLPGKFDEDPRVHFDKTAGKWQYEDDESGQEYEWSDVAQNWIPIIDEADWKAQQAAYSVAGVDEETPANAVLAREERRNAKRKKTEAAAAVANPTAKAAKPAGTPSAPKQTAVWVSNLPPNTTPQLLASVFSKAGVLLIGDDGEPRIKMYYDDEGKFKGDALVMYFKEGSVPLAVTLFDDSELEMGAGYPNMRVKVAEYDKNAKGGKGDKGVKQENGAGTKTNGQGSESHGNGGEASNGAAGGGNGAGEASGSAAGAGEKRRGPTREEKARMSKRIKTMQDKLTWHSDDDDDNLGGPLDGATRAVENPSNRVVVLKGMFTLEELEKEPELLIELKEDVREEAATLGEVTSVVIYDKEPDGVMTVKFKNGISAQACIQKMDGRYFGGQRISAAVYTGRERFKRSGAGGLDDDDEESEQKRLDNFAHWLVEGENEEV